MGRPAKGAVRWNPTTKVWEVRVSLKDGTRSKPIAMTGLPACVVTPADPPTGCACASCVGAEASGQRVSTRMRDGAAVEAATIETATEWYRLRYLPAHVALGNKIVGHLGSWTQYVVPFVGSKPLSEWSPEDVKKIRDNLTKLRLEGTIRAKRALNVWSEQIKAPLSHAFTDDDPAYKGIAVGSAKANPSLGIKPPVSREDLEADERERQPLEPAQFLQLVSCDHEAITLQWRRESAVKCYTGLRPAEIYGLKWPDVRLDAERVIIKVQRGRSMKNGAVIPLKNKQSRRDVPIHPELRPLLRVMREESSDRTGYVFPIPNDRVREVEKNPALARANLKLAGIDAPELTEGGEGLMAFDDRSWRTTFATWCAKAGIDSAWVDAWLGHKPKSTSAKHYVKDTPTFEEINMKAAPPGFVAPFPPLPAALLTRPDSSGGVLAFWSGDPEKMPGFLCEGRDLNPYRSYPAGT